MDISNYELTQSDAEMRSSIIGNDDFDPKVGEVDYDLKLVLPSGKPTYFGQVIIRFNCRSLSDKLWIDAKATNVQSFIVNGEPQTANFDRNRLMLAQGIVQGRNEISITYENLYGNDGKGIHKYIDTQDQNEYIYTQFCVFNAHRCFPCFDQPDLKATMQLSILAPQEWKVIANECLEISTEVNQDWTHESEAIWENRDREGAFTLHKFHRTPRISTYLYAFCVGPFDEFRKTTGPRPLGIYCRKSSTVHLEPLTDTLYTWTEKAFVWYESFFGVPYPFSKYDQVFVPEHHFGAMENVGCVTFNENYIPKEQPVSQAKITNFCRVLVHEMAHMWFGNLVTLTWWEDFWLNESFAEYICHKVMDLGFEGEYENIWEYFNAEKTSGYSADQNKTTHPISVQCADTEIAETLLDAISYCKGSAVLKQLSYVMTDEVFQQGIQAYFKAYSWKNTRANDIINCCQEALTQSGSDIDLVQWAQDWIKTAGLNVLEFQAQSGGGFHIKQLPALAEFPQLRQHSINAYFINASGQIFEKRKLQILPQEITPFTASESNEAAACVILNADDQGYCLVRIDEDSFTWLKDFSNYDETTQRYKTWFDDSMTRTIVWQSLWTSVRNIELPAAEYIHLASKFLSGEDSITINRDILGNTAVALSSYIPSESVKAYYYGKLFKLVLDKMRNASSPEDLAMYKDRLLWFAWNREDIMQMLEWVRSGNTGMEGYEIGNEHKWDILKRYAVLTDEAEEEINTAVAATSGAEIFELYCKYAYPSNKKEKFDEILEKGPNMSNYEQDAIMGGWNSCYDKNVLLPYSQEFFNNFQHVLNNTPKDFALKYTRLMIPSFADDAELLSSIEATLAAIPEGYPAIVRSFKTNIEGFTRRQKAKSLFDEELVNSRIEAEKKQSDI